MENVSITLDMIRAAQSRPKASRGRTKGSSPVERDFRAWYESDSPESFGRVLSMSELVALRRAVNRAANVNEDDVHKVEPFYASLKSLGLIGAEVSRIGEGSDMRVTFGIVRANDENENDENENDENENDENDENDENENG